MDKLKTNLFVYGSLRDSVIFKSVCGFGFTRYNSQVGPDILWAEPAFLDGYRRVSPDNVYYYAVAEPTALDEAFSALDFVPDHATHPYGDGGASARIARQLAEFDESRHPLAKLNAF
jgi:hypothetical protein